MYTTLYKKTRKDRIEKEEVMTRISKTSNIP